MARPHRSVPTTPQAVAVRTRAGLTGPSRRPRWTATGISSRFQATIRAGPVRWRTCPESRPPPVTALITNQATWHSPARIAEAPAIRRRAWCPMAITSDSRLLGAIQEVPVLVAPAVEHPLGNPAEFDLAVRGRLPMPPLNPPHFVQCGPVVRP